ncbi:hypothetical protein H9P43_007018 [Blastocladiella emersonii ATCC 22665]|nr:hypothetical protein H9P43_007018 [Blastocladiella emersonii ATCC 22665]
MSNNTRAVFLPTNVTQATTVLYGSSLYLIGGSNNDVGPLDTTFKLDLTQSFDVASAKMEKLAKMPTPLAMGLAGFSADGGKKILVTAGQTYRDAQSGQYAHNVRGVFEYSVAENSWVAATDFTGNQVPDSDLKWGSIEGVVDMAALPANRAQRVFLIGGSNSTKTELGDVRQIQFKGAGAERFTEIPTDPMPSARLAGLLLRLNSTHLFYSGGYIGEDNRLNDWWTKDLKTNKWVQGQGKMKLGRYAHSGVYVDNRFVLISGGQKAGGEAILLECIDLHTGRVSAVQSTLAATESGTPSTMPPKQLMWHSSALAGRDQLLLLGGYIDYDTRSKNITHNTRLYVGKLDIKPDTILVTWVPKFSGIPNKPAALGPDAPEEANAVKPQGGIPVWLIVVIVVLAIGTVAAVYAAVVIRRRLRAVKEEAERAALVEQEMGMRDQSTGLPALENLVYEQQKMDNQNK